MWPLSSTHSPAGIQPCIQVSVSIDAVTSSYRCKIKQDVPRALSRFVYYSRYLWVLRQKLNGQTSVFPAPKELSLMLRQKRIPQIFVTLLDKVEHACTHRRKTPLFSVSETVLPEKGNVFEVADVDISGKCGLCLQMNSFQNDLG